MINYKLYGLILGGILAQASSIIDGCDGEVARLKFLTTDYGAFVDILDKAGMYTSFPDHF